MVYWSVLNSAFVLVYVGDYKKLKMGGKKDQSASWSVFYTKEFFFFFYLHGGFRLQSQRYAGNDYTPHVKVNPIQIGL